MAGLRIPVATLIERAEEKRAQLVAQHRSELDEWRQRESLADLRLDLADDLAKLANDIRAGRVKPRPGSRYDHAKRTYVPTLSASVCIAGPPEKPAPLSDRTAKVDRDLSLLRATSQEHVTVRTGSEFADYL